MSGKSKYSALSRKRSSKRNVFDIRTKSNGSSVRKRAISSQRKSLRNVKCQNKTDLNKTLGIKKTGEPSMTIKRSKVVIVKKAGKLCKRIEKELFIVKM